MNITWVRGARAWIATSLAVVIGVCLFDPPARGEDVILGPVTEPVAGGPSLVFPWMHAGLKLTYLRRQAVVQGARFGSYPDPRGRYYDPTTGQRMSAAERNTGGAAMYYAQYTILAVDRDTTLVRADDTYAFDPLALQRAPSHVLRAGVVADLGKNTPGQSLFVPLYTLGIYLKTPAQNVTSARREYKVGTHTFDAIHVEQKSVNFYSLSIYDLQTGLLLSSLTDSISQPVRRGFAGDSDAGDEHIDLSDLAMARDVKTPWMDEAPPAWVGTVQALRYAGPRDTHRPTFTPTNETDDISITLRGPTWVAGTEGNAASVWGSAMLHGMWAGPAALGQLRAGQSLDEDPLTKAAVTVSKADGNYVVITDRNESRQEDYTYDKRDGRLVQYHSISPVTNEEVTRRLVGTR